MTRLIAADVASIGLDWPSFDEELRNLTGGDLFDLCASALEIDLFNTIMTLSRYTVGIVPDPSGEGIIEGFGQALARTANHLGCEAFITAPAPAGFNEVRERGSMVTLHATDTHFFAVNFMTGQVSNNQHATGAGFAEALVLMAGGSIKGRRVLVVGAGPVGRLATSHLLWRGAKPVILDVQTALAERAAVDHPGSQAWTPKLGRVPEDFDLIFDASTAANLWPEERIPDGALIAAPGMPRAIPNSPRYRQWHEPLVTGTAMMIIAAALVPAAVHFPSGII